MTEALFMGLEKFEGNALLLFFFIAYAWSWSFWALQLLGMDLHVAAFGPFVAAFLLTYAQEGKMGVKGLLKKGFDSRIGKIWYVPTILLWPAYYFFSIIAVSTIILARFGAKRMVRGGEVKTWKWEKLSP